jgi:hypothetical protein
LSTCLHACTVGALPLEPHLQAVSAVVVLEMGSCKLFAWTGLEHRSILQISQVARIIGTSPAPSMMLLLKVASAPCFALQVWVCVNPHVTCESGPQSGDPWGCFTLRLPATEPCEQQKAGQQGSDTRNLPKQRCLLCPAMWPPNHTNQGTWLGWYCLLIPGLCNIGLLLCS